MAFGKIPEGYQSPGYVIVSIFTPEGKDAVVNVYGTYPSRPEAVKERKRMIRETEEREHSTFRELQQRWSLLIRQVHDIPQMNRLLEEQENAK